MKKKLYFADLTHTAQGISAPTFPLGISFVVSYARKELGAEFDCRLFKFPDSLEQAIRDDPPVMLCFSNYSWNMELAYKMGALAKARDPKLIVVFGGPNFPTVEVEQQEYLEERPMIDFYIQLEGEMGFVDLVRRLETHDFDQKALKSSGERVLNTSYLAEGKIITGPIERIRDINLIPSPYLTDVLDEFFDWPLIPMLETTRGCPFSCTFCADGVLAKSRVFRFDEERTKEELWFIARKVKKIDELIITDLNFAMYAEDLKTAAVLAEIKQKHRWPVTLSASAGKNRPHRTIEVASILQGTWTLGASIQSTDPEVLKSIKRSNISSAAYKELIDYGNNLKNAKTHSEIILGLPGDTKQRHFESLRFGVENRVNSMRMFQAMLLRGTEMASKADREKYGLVTRFRTIPGCIGLYEFFGEKHAVAEIEEIIVGSKTMSFSDYLECRVMNLIVETFYNNSSFDEVFAMLQTMGVSIFDVLLHLKGHPELYTPEIKEIIADFIHQTSHDLFNTFEEARSFVLTPEIVDKYIGGELGINELLVSKARLVGRQEQITELLFTVIRESLREANRLTAAVESYLSDLQRLVIHRKKDIFANTDRSSSDTFDFDFKAISEIGYRVDPDTLTALDSPVAYRFFHDDFQKQHIAHQVGVYAKTPMGIARLIQRSNLKLMYRHFEEIPLSEKRDLARVMQV